MTQTYAIADLHGRFDLLEEALRLIELREPGMVVFTGDYVDRGPQSRQIIERLMAGPTKPGWTWKILRGNHEEIMLICLASLNWRWWLPNGGGATLISYGQREGELCDPSVVPQAHRDFLAGLPLTYDDGHRLFVHAGVDPTLPLAEQSEKELTWMLYPEGCDLPSFEGRHIVHGHHQFAHGPITLKNRTDLDTFAWATGRLVVGVFEDGQPGGPVGFIEVRGPTIEELREAARRAA